MLKTRKMRRLESVVMDAVEANVGIHPVRFLVEMEQAISAMHSKDYGPDGLAAVMVDVMLSVTNPEFRNVWVDA